MSKKRIPVPGLIAIDCTALIVALCVFALFHHVLPRHYQNGTRDLVFTGEKQLTSLPLEGSNQNTNLDQETNTVQKESTSTTIKGYFGEKFADKFTEDGVIKTETGYQGENISVEVRSVSENQVTYYIEDIYIKEISLLKTAFAEDTYGKSLTAWPLTMAIGKNAIVSINGDYYGIHDTGVVIRNGYVYREEKDDTNDICVIFWDGTMKVYKSDEFEIEDAIQNGAYQAWSFGPSLLNEQAEAIENFHSSISRQNPRTAIGYYEPGHYCFITVDGRGENNSQGMTLSELSKLCEQLGLKAAYNLDGGKSSAMTFGNQLVNSPSDGGRKDTDIIYIGE